MTMSQDTISDDLKAFTHAVHTWVDSVQKFVGWKTPDGETPSAYEVVDNYFHVLERILFIQRDVTKSFLGTKAY